MNKTVSDILLGAIKERLATGIGHRALEGELGLENNALKGLLDQKSPRTPSVERAKEIAEALGLEFYVGPPRSDPPQSPKPMIKAEDAATDRLKRLGVAEEDLHAFEVRDHGMEPQFRHGDRVIAAKLNRYPLGAVLAVEFDGRQTLKRSSPGTDGRSIVLFNQNPASPFGAVVVDGEGGFAILGLVVWHGHWLLEDIPS